ncbi:MAG: zf-HC2 domain-containing protein [Thermomicrobiales bacterium]
MNAECRELRPLLSAYMDNELTPDELRVVQAHVATCPDCAAVLREYRQVRSSMRALSQPVPPAELRAAVFARATPAYRRRATVITFGQRGLSYTALAAAVVAILFTGALLFRSGVGPAIMGAPDTTPPRITALDPLPNVDAWGLNKPIRITFSEPMDQASVVAALSISADPPLSDDERQQLLQSAKWDGNTLVIGEGVALQPYTDYTISIDANRARQGAERAARGREHLQVPHGRCRRRAADADGAIVAVVPPSPSPTATPRPTEAPHHRHRRRAAAHRAPHRCPGRRDQPDTDLSRRLHAAADHRAGAADRHADHGEAANTDRNHRRADRHAAADEHAHPNATDADRARANRDHPAAAHLHARPVALRRRPIVRAGLRGGSRNPRPADRERSHGARLPPPSRAAG